MENYLNVKCMWRHCVLEHLIKKNDMSPEMTRAAVFEREVKAAMGVKNWSEIHEELLKLRNIEEAQRFFSIQAYYSEETSQRLKIIMDDIMQQLKLQKLRTTLLVELLQLNYLRLLEREKLTIKTEAPNEEEIDLPELFKLFATLVLSEKDSKDSEELIKIWKILVEWRNKT